MRAMITAGNPADVTEKRLPYRTLSRIFKASIRARIY
jgi:hypothetical protein